METKGHLTVDDCLKLYESEGITGLVEKVKEIAFKAGYEKARMKFTIEMNQLVLKTARENRLVGIKEVVEWIFGKCEHPTRPVASDTTGLRINCWKCRRELKEWGSG